MLLWYRRVCHWWCLNKSSHTHTYTHTHEHTQAKKKTQRTQKYAHIHAYLETRKFFFNQNQVTQNLFEIWPKAVTVFLLISFFCIQKCFAVEFSFLNNSNIFFSDLMNKSSWNSHEKNYVDEFTEIDTQKIYNTPQTQNIHPLKLLQIHC